MEVNSATYSDMTDWNKHKVVWSLKSSNHSHSKCCGRSCSYETMSGLVQRRWTEADVFDQSLFQDNIARKNSLFT